jgi:hypothetical protein
MPRRHRRGRRWNRWYFETRHALTRADRVKRAKPRESRVGGSFAKHLRKTPRSGRRGCGHGDDREQIAAKRPSCRGRCRRCRPARPAQAASAWAKKPKSDRHPRVAARGIRFPGEGPHGRRKHCVGMSCNAVQIALCGMILVFLIRNNLKTKRFLARRGRDRVVPFTRNPVAVHPATGQLALEAILKAIGPSSCACSRRSTVPIPVFRGPVRRGHRPRGPAVPAGEDVPRFRRAGCGALRGRAQVGRRASVPSRSPNSSGCPVGGRAGR